AALILSCGLCPKKCLRSTTFLAVATVWSMGLAGILLLPFREFLQYSNRHGALEFSEATRWSLNPASLLSVFFPHRFMSLERERNWGLGYWEDNIPYIASLYPGLLVVLSLGFALWVRIKKIKKVFEMDGIGWLLMAVGIFLALGRYNP